MRVKRPRGYSRDDLDLETFHRRRESSAKRKRAAEAGSKLSEPSEKTTQGRRRRKYSVDDLSCRSSRSEKLPRKERPVSRPLHPYQHRRMPVPISSIKRHSPLNYSQDDLSLRPSSSEKRKVTRQSNPYSTHYSREYPPLSNRREVLEEYKQLPGLAAKHLRRKYRELRHKVTTPSSGP
jgi:hypothetical protein